MDRVLFRQRTRGEWIDDRQIDPVVDDFSEIIYERLSVA